MQGYFIKSYKSNYKNVLNGRGKLTSFLFILLLAENADFSNQGSRDNNDIGNVFISPEVRCCILSPMGDIPYNHILLVFSITPLKIDQIKIKTVQ